MRTQGGDWATKGAKPNLTPNPPRGRAGGSPKRIETPPHAVDIKRRTVCGCIGRRTFERDADNDLVCVKCGRRPE